MSDLPNHSHFCSVSSCFIFGLSGSFIGNHWRPCIQPNFPAKRRVEKAQNNRSSSQQDQQACCEDNSGMYLTLTSLLMLFFFYRTKPSLPLFLFCFFLHLFWTWCSCFLLLQSPDGDIIDCAVSHLQPAFDHPQLKGQKPLVSLTLLLAIYLKVFITHILEPS